MRIPTFVYLSVWLCIGLGCGSEDTSCEERKKEIEHLEGRLFTQDGNSVQANVRAELMRAYASFANACHDADETPEMLFRRADLLRSVGRFQEAMTQLRDVHDHYGEYEKRSVCAFLVGFIAEVELNDRAQAKKTYEQVIEVHPNSEAATWAKQSLELLSATEGGQQPEFQAE
jgi:TolA-binding protein